MACRRPEHKAPPEIFYDETEAKKYSSSSRMQQIQRQLSERAIELLMLPEDTPCFILDIGCGSGLSGECLTELGHMWVGFDISSSMLDVAIDREVEGDLVLADMGGGVPFKPASFDGVISISALQWMCNADRKDHHVPKRLYHFFSTLYASMCRGARAVFQFYPESSDQVELITHQAMKAGFTGGLVIDYPNSTKAKKIFLCLMAGGVLHKLPKALGTGEDIQGRHEIEFSSSRQRLKAAKQKKKAPKKSREWILEKKERRRRQGRDVRPDNKYTGRKRPTSF